MPAKKQPQEQIAALNPLDWQPKYVPQELAFAIGEKRHSLESIASRVCPVPGERGGRSVGNLDYIAGGASPFSLSKNGINIRELIELSEISFHTYQSYRNAILNQVFLSNSGILVRGENEQRVNFFKDWLEKINIWNLCNEFFTEWYRSGNIFIWRSNTEITLSDIRERSKNKETTAKVRKIPLRYTILDPKAVNSLGSATFVNQLYGKLLTAYEVERYKTPSTPEEREFVRSLTPDERAALKKGTPFVIKLTPDNLIAIFNNKQPYEPLAVPTYTPILQSINLKKCMRQADLLLMETIDMVVFFVTAGVEAGNGNQINERIIKSLTMMLQSKGAGKAIVTHYSAKAEFVVPDLTKIMSADRYEALDREIAAGLMDIFSMEDSYASSYTKTKIYLELLQQSRDAFLTQFLIPEMKRISRELGWDDYVPDVQFEEISLENETEKLKIFVRLYEMGQLTPEGLEQAFKSKELPLTSLNVQQQKNFKKQKDEGNWQPIAANMGDESSEGGRPTGTTQKQSKKTVRPAGAEIEAEDEGVAYMDVIQNNISKMNVVFSEVERVYKEKYNVQRLSKKTKAICETVATNVISCEPIEKWNEETVREYLDNPFSVFSTPQKQEILALSREFDIPCLSAAIFFHGKKPSQE